MTNYNELIGRYLVYVSLKKGDKPEIIMSVGSIIEEVDDTTMKSHLFLRVNGKWAACICKSDVDKAIATTGREMLSEEYYSYIKIV